MKPPLLLHERILRIVVIAALGLALGLLLAKSFLLPGLGLPCGFRKLSGLPCAMCGGTRATAALLRGDLGQAIHWNAMALPVITGMAALAGIFLLELIHGSAVIDWNPLRKRIGRLLPLSLTLFAAWWGVHVFSALKTPKPDLVDFQKPIPAVIADFLGIR
jgi:hypothetical protein